MKISIIGGGSIGGATAFGLAEGTFFKPSDITVTAAHEATLEKFAAKGMKTTIDNKEAVKDSDIVVIAVKPWLVDEVLEDLKPALDYSRHTIVCLASRISDDLLENLKDGNGRKPWFLHVIPNTAIELRQSVTFICPTNSDEEHTELVRKIFEDAGIVFVVNEKLLISGMALASCGMAYVFRYIRAAVEGGVELGFRPDDAERIVSLTVKGASSLVEAHNSHPEVEIDKVTTPGGLAIKGLNAMEEAGFSNSVIIGLKASVK